MTESHRRLGPLFNARTVAVIGASEKGHYAASLIQNLLKFGFPRDRIFPVNPRYDSVFGLSCYGKIMDTPGDVDLAVLLVARDRVPQVLEECGEKRIPAALIVATGFAESDDKGRKLQSEIIRLSQLYRIAVCGPNTLGFIATQGGLGLWSSPLPQHLKPGSVGAVFNSSGLLNLFLYSASDRCLGFRYAVASGNEADLSLVDYLSWMVEDPEVEVITTLIESVKDPEKLISLLDLARENGKPIVALRVGRSAKGSHAVVSHTGNLATSGAVWDSLFRQKGVISVDNMDQMLEEVVLLANRPARRFDRTPKGVGLVTISGGDCSFLSDICDRISLNLPDLSGETYRKLTNYFAKENFNGNPLDVEDLHLADDKKFYECLRVFVAEEAFGLLGCRLTLPKVPNSRLMDIYSAATTIAREAGKTIVFFSRATEQLDPSWFRFFSGLGVPFLLEYEKGLRAIRDALWFSSRLPRAASEPTGDESPVASDRLRLKPILRSTGNGRLTYREYRQILDAYRIPVVQEALTASAKEAMDAATSLGFPVALKVVSGDLPHKTEIGGVRLGVQEEKGVEEAFQVLEQQVRRKAPGVKIGGILVQKMVTGAVEVIVGSHLDPQLGPVVLFGLGGIYTEILKDVSLRVAPISSVDAREMIGEIKGYALLVGARGRPRADIEALVDVLVSVSQLAVDLRDHVATFELNPLMVLPEGQGALAVDTLWELQKSQ